MSEGSESEAPACREFELLMMGRLDGEISPEQEKRLDEHLETCPSCRAAFGQYSKLVTATAEVEMKDLSREESDIYWCRVYNRLERGTAWVLVSLGAVLAFTYAAFRVVMHFARDPEMAFWAKAGVLALALGLALLFVSVLREKLCVRRADKYRKVKR